MVDSSQSWHLLIGIKNAQNGVQQRNYDFLQFCRAKRREQLTPLLRGWMFVTVNGILKEL